MASPTPGGPRRHHFLPQFYLAGFTLTGQKDGELWVLSRPDGKRWQGTPNTVGHQRDFYRADEVPGLQPDAVEKLFSTVEDLTAPVLKTISEQQRLPAAESSEYNLLLNFIAAMIARVPKTRSVLSGLIESIGRLFARSIVGSRDAFDAAVKKAREAGEEIPEEVDYDQMRGLIEGDRYLVEASQPWLLRGIFDSIDILLPLLAARKWLLLCSDDAAGDFITSDCPVALTWTKPNPASTLRPAFGLPETDMTLPLSRRTALLGRFKGPQGRLEATPAIVAAVNHLTGFHCDRFVCSAREEFLWLMPDRTIGSSKDAAAAIRFTQ